MRHGRTVRGKAGNAAKFAVVGQMLLIALVASTLSCASKASGENGPLGDDDSNGAGGTNGVDGGANSPGATCTGAHCVPADCTDGTMDGTETGVDCGGSCAACASGSGCAAAADCASMVCTSGACAAPSPTDTVANDSETDVDCGGAKNADGTANSMSDGAPACAQGKACKTGYDCETGACTASVCAAPSPMDGVMNGTETDVDCGGSAAMSTDGAMACADGLHCLVGSDCKDGVCSGATNGSTPPTYGTCAMPSCMDTVKNGMETDVDCGGSCGPCAVNKGCMVAGDCTTAACNYNHLCVSAPSCIAHNGGDTCGPGETGDANAMHEDCCTAITVPRPTASGGPFVLDKYLITAGRMRAFLEAVNYDVQGYIMQHTPAWWPTGSTATTWMGMLPMNHDDFIYLTSNGGSGCVVGTGSGAVGAPAMWENANDLMTNVSGAPRTFTQAVMDQKVMNCFRGPLFHALCAYDGGRMPSDAEWTAARTTWTAAGVATVMKLPWANDGAAYGTTADKQAHSVYDSLAGTSYMWPNAPTDNDYGSYLASPGRFPLGNGPYGHADLAGSVENMGAKPGTNGIVSGDGWFQDSFQETEVHAYAEEDTGFGDGSYRPHWAVGGRCMKLPH